MIINWYVKYDDQIINMSFEMEDFELEDMMFDADDFELIDDRMYDYLYEEVKRLEHGMTDETKKNLKEYFEKNFKDKEEE